MTTKLALNATSVLFACLIVASACGGGAAPTSAGSPAVSAPAAPTATAAATKAAPTVAPTPTPTPKPVVWPLTGLKADDPAAIKRRPLNIRLPNDPNARPQYGLSKADLVFEMIVEGGVTRYSAIFHSRDVDSVGPIRSYRFSDLYLTQMLKGALVASGATVEERDAVTESVRVGNMISVDAERDGRPYFRVSFRVAPNNLFTSTQADREAVNRAGGAGPVDVPALAFLPSTDHEATAGGFAGSVPARTATVPFQAWPATFTWDEGSKGFRRSQQGAQTVDGDGSGAILARNVIVMTTDITTTSVIEDSLGSRGLDYRMTGGGPATVFRDGRRQDGTWKRDGVLDMFSFSNQAGEKILLSPGQSWIHFIYPGWTVTSAP
ncbi:MAG TPA: DUF3048 domain-containing protein [Candidatus Saccharimonadales bacterium]|nr:DUF3048 domain-containing protein [Candidatus Saccharimonadales bacterium]